MYVGCLLVVCVVMEAEKYTNQTKTLSHPTVCAIRNIFQEVHMNCPSLDSLIRLHGGGSGDWFDHGWTAVVRQSELIHKWMNQWVNEARKLLDIEQNEWRDMADVRQKGWPWNARILGSLRLPIVPSSSNGKDVEEFYPQELQVCVSPTQLVPFITALLKLDTMVNKTLGYILTALSSIFSWNRIHDHLDWDVVYSCIIARVLVCAYSFWVCCSGGTSLEESQQSWDMGKYRQQAV